MKKFLIWLLAAIPAVASAQQAFDLVVPYRNSTNTGNNTFFVPKAATNTVKVVISNGFIDRPDSVTLGSGLTYASGTLDVTTAPVNADWDAITGPALILHKPTLFSGAYADLTGKPALFDGQFSSLTGLPNTCAGYGITDCVTPSALTSALSGYVQTSTLSNYATTAFLASSLATKFDVPTGTTAQYIRGDGSVATFPSIPPAITLTTTGSGAATYNGTTGALNIPTPAAGGSGTVTSITAGTGLSGGTITTTGTISLPSTGTAGTYSGVTTDAQGRVTAGTTRSVSYGSRSLNTCFQISASRDALVSYSVDIATVSTLLSGQVGTIYLRTYTNSGCSTGAQEVARFVNGNTQTLGVSVTMTQNVTGTLTGVVSAGAWAQLVTENNTGTPTFTSRSGQEVLL